MEFSAPEPHEASTQGDRASLAKHSARARRGHERVRAGHERARIKRNIVLRVPAQLDMHPLRQPAQVVQLPLEHAKPVPLGAHVRVVLLDLLRVPVPLGMPRRRQLQLRAPQLRRRALVLAAARATYVRATQRSQLRVPVRLATHPRRQPAAQDVQVPLAHAQSVSLGPHVRVVLLNRLRVPAQLDMHPLRQPAQVVQLPLVHAQSVSLGPHVRVVLLNPLHAPVRLDTHPLQQHPICVMDARALVKSARPASFAVGGWHNPSHAWLRATSVELDRHLLHPPPICVLVVTIGQHPHTPVGGPYLSGTQIQLARDPVHAFLVTTVQPVLRLRRVVCVPRVLSAQVTLRHLLCAVSQAPTVLPELHLRREHPALPALLVHLRTQASRLLRRRERVVVTATLRLDLRVSVAHQTVRVPVALLECTVLVAPTSL